MTSIDKLSKSFEFLKVPIQMYDPEQRKQDVKQIPKKDKIQHLNLVYENIVSANVRQSDDYIKMLSLATETFLVYFDDEDQDVYFVAEECLNKTVKTLLDTNLTRFPADLYRYIRKNGPERSLKGAIVRFAELCHLIKPHKCRIYVEFLLKENTIAKIAKRPEESIQNVLISSMTKICSAFCWSMTDNELKMLMQSFLPNLSNESPVSSYRRVSANCLSIICLYSSSPYTAYSYLHQELLKLVLPLNDTETSTNKFTILGVLLCFRCMIIHLAELDKASSSSSLSSPSFLSTSNSFTVTPSSSFNKTTSLITSPVSSPTSATATNTASFKHATTKKMSTLSSINLISLCEIYEICMHYLNFDDNRIVIASLECLQVLFKLMPFKFHTFLTKTGAMSESFVSDKKLFALNSRNDTLESSQKTSSSPNTSLSTQFFLNKLNDTTDKTDLNDSSMEDSLADNNALNLSTTSLTGSMDSLNTLKLAPIQPKGDATNLDQLASTESSLETSITDAPALQQADSAETRTLIEQNDFNDENIANEKSSYPFKTPSSLIGKFYDSNKMPLVYFARFLAYKYLLNVNYNETASKLKPDSECKVLVKAVALDCCASAITLCPNLLFNNLYEKTSSNEANESINLYIYDLIEYINHNDDKMRTIACLLIGQFINTVLNENDGNYDSWLNKMSKTNHQSWFGMLRIEHLVDYLMRFIKLDNQRVTNNICKRFSLSSLHSFLPTLIQTKHASLGLGMLVNLLHLRHSTYNLVKCELVDLIASIDFKSVNYTEQLLPGDCSSLNRMDNELNEEFDDDLAKSSENYVNKKVPAPFLVRKTQERILNDVYLYLLGSEDSKLRLETAKSLARFVLNMNFYEVCSCPNQNSLLSLGEHALKACGYGQTLFSSSMIDNDAFNLASISLLFNKPNSNATTSSSSTTANTPSTSSSGYSTPTSLLHGNKQRQIKYSCSPLNSISLLSSLPWLSKSNNILNNNFIQPFHSLIKYWPTSASFSNSINNSLNKLVEHNLNHLVPLLTKTLIDSIDKFQFIGCLESLDFIFQTYQPAIFYSSPITDSNSSSNFQQIFDLLNLLISLLRHPFVAFDLYVHDILLRLIGTLLCSYSWLSMKQLDKLVQQINLNLNQANQTSPASSLMLEQLNNSVKNIPYQQSQAELATGLTYSYNLAFNNQLLKGAIDQLFVHTMKMLCVLACVIEDAALPSNLTTNLNSGSTAVTPLPHVPTPPTNLASSSSINSTNSTQSVVPPSPSSTNSASSSRSSSPNFLRSKLNNITDSGKSASRGSVTSLSFLNKDSKTKQSNTNQQQQPPASPTSTVPDPTNTNPAASLPKTSTNVYLGYFQNSSHYLKLYEVCKVAFNSYKKSPSIGTYDRFTQMVKSTLKLFAQLLESALGVHEIGPHLDEILLYLKVIFSLESSCSVKCVTLTLKSLFSLNLSGLMYEYIQQQLNKMPNLNAQATINNNTSLPMSLPLSSVLSSSLTSLASNSQIPTSGHVARPQDTSIHSTLIANHLSQFTKFMYSQSIMFKSDNLIGIHFNPSNQLLASASISASSGYDTIDYLSSNQNSSLNQGAKTAAQTPTTVAKQNTSFASSSSPFNLFNLIRKNKNEPVNIQQQQEQQKKELQQQKLKQQKTDLKTIAQYIKSFESIVIRSLRQYTLTTSVNLQTRILELLTQLIFLKVDYCLLDSDKVFIDYVLKQFEYLEQKRTATTTSQSSTDQEDTGNGANVLAKSYLFDLYENFDSESSIADPLNPFDLDTMLNKLCSSLHGPQSSSLGVGSSNSYSRAMHATGMSASSSNSYGSSSPILSSLSHLKQHEHQRNFILIPKLFDFLILLSHEKKTQPTNKTPTQQGKSGSGLLTVPEVMQLCDNLIASENSPHTHAIPALRPLVIDLFLNRSSEDSKEIDLQHDVIMMTLLRLVQYPQMWPLLTIAVSKYKKDNEEKWKKSSRQICDAIFDSMRSAVPNNRLKFNEFNGNEMRAIRRYSRAYVPCIESLKQLIMLLSCLAPQVFRPIDFIILSLFEISKYYIRREDELSNNELNNWLCVLIVHMHLLLSHSTEEQILVRLHHLMPQIIASYNEVVLFEPNTPKTGSASNSPDSNSPATSSASSRRNSDISDHESSGDEKDERKANIQRQDQDESESISTSYSNKTTTSGSSGNYDEKPNYKYAEAGETDADLDLNESALFLSKFLLRIIEKAFVHVDKHIKFNAPMYFSTNLSASSSSSLLRDHQTNSYRDLNYSQHLLANKILFLMYLINSGIFVKISNSISMLINDKDTSKVKHSKSKEFDSKRKRHSTDKKQQQPHQEERELESGEHNSNYFNFDSSKFTFKINKIILFKLSKTNPYLASMWQYFLIMCNFQDPEYWLLSTEKSSKLDTFNIQSEPNKNDSTASNQAINDADSTSSSNNNSLNQQSEDANIKNQQHKSKKKTKTEPLKEALMLPSAHIKHPTLNEQLFRYLSMTIYCDYMTSRNQLDNTVGLTMILVNNLVELFELSAHESTVWDLLSTIHRNSAASCLFIQSINLNWSSLVSKRKLYLLLNLLKSLEGVHLSASSHLLNLLIDKYFNLPYLSLVRYADHIACQRVEMMQSLAADELLNQLTEQHVKVLNKFYNEQFKYSYRHRRLISLLEQLKRLINDYSTSSESETENRNSIIDESVVDKGSVSPSSPTSSHLFSNPAMKTSPSIDFFMLYVSNSKTTKPQSSIFANLDKEWYYNIVRSACCYATPTTSQNAAVFLGPNSSASQNTTTSDIICDSSSLKSKQCALMLSNLDFSNASQILTAKHFKLSILKDCILLGAHRTQLDIQKLPSALKKAAQSSNLNFEKDFMHPLWLASTSFLFELLNDLCSKLPKPPIITIATHSSNASLFSSTWSIYESKLNELYQKYDFYTYLAPITESINAYLRCIYQYPCLQHQLGQLAKSSDQAESNIFTASSTSQTGNTEKINNLITFITFQFSYINHLSTNKNHVLTINSLNQSLMCIFNLLVDPKLLSPLCQRANYSTLISYLIKDIYDLIMHYFFKLGDENLIHTPTLSPSRNIDYSTGQNLTNDVLFSTATFDTLLKLRYLLTNFRSSSSVHHTGADSSESGGSDSLSSMKGTFCASTNTHRFLQDQSHFFRQTIPLNMRDLIDKIYLSICRLPILDRFIRIPDSLWRTPGFKLDYGQFLKNDTSALPPLEYLRDPQILKEHLKHILFVGWTTRTQFEYEYVNMLTLLHNLSEDYYLPMTSASDSPSNDDETSKNSASSSTPKLVTNLPIEEIKERNKCICLVIKGLSSWLIKSTLTPKSGSSLNSLYEHVSRNKTPSFLESQLGRQYCQVKRIIDSFYRNNLYTKMNSVSISNNPNLLYMLDPTLIDEIEKNKKKAAAHLVSSINHQPNSNRPLDFTQPQPTADALANLFQISMNLSQRDYNLLFSTNIERLMTSNLASNADTYYYYTQISLEGLLKFLGHWNRNNNASVTKPSQAQLTAASIAASITNLVNPSLVDEMSTKTANAINSLIKVAEFLTEDTDLMVSRSSSSSNMQSDGNQLENESALPNPSIENSGSGAGLNNNNNTAHSSQTILRSFNRNNLDLTSVLRTVLDYYESFFKNPCLQLKLDIFRSILYLSNSLFDSKHQYESLYNKLQNNFDWLNGFIQQDNDPSMPLVNELIDESILSIAIYAECLCKCCLQTSKSENSTGSFMSSKDFERLNRIFENGFKPSSSLSIKISTIHGLIYWLESISLGYISNSNDARQLVDHLCKQINQMKDLSVYLTSNPKYISTLWSAVFYAIENCLDSIRDAQSFVGTFIKLTYQILNDVNTPYFLFYQLYMGLERFLLSNMVPSFEINTIQRLFSSKFNDEQRSLCLTSLIVTSLYASNPSRQINYWNDIVQQLNQNTAGMSTSNSLNNMNSPSFQSPSVSPLESPTRADNPLQNSQQQSNSNMNMSEKAQMSGYPQILELSSYPDLQANLLKVLEVATTFLDKMKSSATAKEASVYASLLPKLFCDFLPPHDLLNKLITEFLNSSQHPYPEAVAFVLFKCFDLLQEKGLQSQIQEWCLLSLSNFLQRTSIYESIWLTSCLLVSATRNQWLKSTFPFLLNRYCAFETIDRAIFYMSVIEFRKQLQDKSQIQSIHATFESVAKPGTPYDELIKLLNSQEQDGI